MKKLLLIFLFFVFKLTYGQIETITNNINQNIPDFANPNVGGFSVVSFSSIPEGSTITNVSYNIRINHPNHSELSARIADNYNATTGLTEVILSSNGSSGSGNFNITGTTNLFNGLNPNMDIYVRVWDNATNNTGYIDYFTVTVNYTLPPNPLVSHVTPPLSSPVILGESVTFTVHGINLTNDTAYHLPDFGDGVVNSSSSTTQKTFTVTSSYNVGIKHGEIKDEIGGTVLKNFDIEVYFPTPTNLTATTQSNSQINLSWNAVNNAYEYKLYRSNSQNGTYTLRETTTSTSFHDTDLNSNTTYYYKIQACQASNQNSCSSQSNSISATTDNETSNFLTVSPTSITQDSNGGSNTVQVSSNVNWTVSESLNWLSTSTSNGSDNGSFNISINENTNTSSRNGTITVTGDGISRQINITQNGVSNVDPNIPTFVSVPSQLNLNETYNFVFQSGTDPNDDLTRVKVSATNSDLSPNPYLTNLQNGGNQFTVPFAFTQTGNQTITIQTIDSNNNESTTENATVTVVEDNTPINEVQIGNITFTASSIVELSTDYYELSGNVNANNILQFDGTVIVDINSLSVSGNGRIYLNNIPNLGDVDLYNGEFNYSVNSDTLTDALLNETNELFKLINLPVNIDSITLLSDGINLTGEIKFPELFGYVSTSISQIQITQSNGLQAVGDISLSEINVYNDAFKINNLDLSFDTINNKFSGNGSVETPLINAAANVEIIESGIDQISLYLEFNNPIPLGTTGLQLTALGGGVENIQNPPLLLSIDVSLNPVGVSPDIIDFNNVGLQYEWGYSLTGTGGVTLLGQQAATASFSVSDGRFNITANVNMFNILESNFTTNINKKNDGNLDVFARFDATVTIPAVNTGSGFPYDYIDSGINESLNLPLELANFDNILHNRKLFGKGSLLSGESLKFSYLYEYENGQVIKDWAWNFSNFTENFTDATSANQELIFRRPSTLFTNKLSPKYSRFEGRSLVIKPSNYTNRTSLNEYVQDFVLPSVMETIVVRVQPNGNGSIPTVSLTNPVGDIIDASNFSNYDGYIYSVNTDTNGVYFTIIDAPMGSWSINIVDTGQENLTDIFGTKGLSGIIVDNINKIDSNLTINWTDFDEDFNGNIALYYSRGNDGLDGTMIVNNLFEDDETDTYTFDVSNLDPGQYYVYALMYDADGNFTYSYSQDSFTIGSNIQAPTNLGYTLNPDNSITFNWTKLDDTDNYDYILYYQEEGEVDYNSLNINTGNSDSYTFYDLDSEPIYQFMVIAQDTNDFLSEKSNTVDIDLAKYQILNLHQGWNLIGFNVEPFNLSVEEVISPITSNIIEVRNETQSYDPNINPLLNTLHTIENGKGYWVKLLETEQLNIRGKSIDINNLNINLNPGWNLISYPKTITQDVATALSSISDFIIEVRNEIQSYDPNINPLLNTLHQLEPNKGYWIKVNQNCTLTF